MSFLQLLTSLYILFSPLQAHAYTGVPVVLYNIAVCESQMTQFNADGSLVRNGDHIGLYQISTKVWGHLAKEFGVDLTTAQGNTEMAIYIFNRYGTQSWLASEKCWSGADTS